MNAYQLADLAAVIAVHSRPLVSASPEIMDRTLSAYWKASRCRLDRWCHNLRLLTNDSERQAWTPDETGVVEEILVSEILSRAIGAIATAHDQQHSQAESAPIARNVFSGHLDVRRRAIALFALPQHVGTTHAQNILALHRQCERWSDLLLAYLTAHVAVDEFAVSPVRVSDFAYDAHKHLQSSASSEMALTMLLAGMRSSLVPLSKTRSPNTDLNLEIAAAVIGCIAPESFDSFGLLSSAWLEKLRSVPNETLAVLSEWWQPAAVKTAASAAPRWRR